MQLGCSDDELLRCLLLLVSGRHCESSGGSPTIHDVLLLLFQLLYHGQWLLVEELVWVWRQGLLTNVMYVTIGLLSRLGGHQGLAQLLKRWWWWWWLCHDTRSRRVRRKGW